MLQRILVALDDSESSAKAIDYVAEMVGGKADACVHLVHVLAPLPEVMPAKAVAAMRRSNPDDAAQRAQQALLERYAGRLREAGLAADHVDTGVVSVPQGQAVIGALLDTARDQRCGTIVVGRNTLPWHRELFHQHWSDEIVKKARGFTVWVVE